MLQSLIGSAVDPSRGRNNADEQAWFRRLIFDTRIGAGPPLFPAFAVIFMGSDNARIVSRRLGSALGDSETALNWHRHFRDGAV
jgi:hypothetical protein